jgi:hypothetical protein
LAVGRYDGTVSIYETATGKRVSDPIRPALPQRGAARTAQQ